MADFQTAMATRSLKTVKAELEFLSAISVITPTQLSTILSSLPSESSIPSLCKSLSNTSISQTPTPTPKTTSTVSEKSTLPAPAQQFQPPPPSYSDGPQSLAVVSALYEYSAQDSGDLALKPGDIIHVTEYTNADWWRGTNRVTGTTGVFPKAYVRDASEKEKEAAREKEKDGYGYGNMPLQVSNSHGQWNHGQSSGSGYQEPEKPSKVEEQGKKFGKKLGNAAIFGAGATIGGKIVNGIF